MIFKVFFKKKKREKEKIIKDLEKENIVAKKVMDEKMNNIVCTGLSDCGQYLAVCAENKQNSDVKIMRITINKCYLANPFTTSRNVLLLQLDYIRYN